MKTKEFIKELQKHDPSGEMDMVFHYWYTDIQMSSHLKTLELDENLPVNPIQMVTGREIVINLE